MCLYVKRRVTVATAGMAIAFAALGFAVKADVHAAPLPPGVCFEIGAAATIDTSKPVEITPKIEDATEAESTEPEEPKEQYNMVIANVKDAVNVRAEADEDSEKLGKLYKDCYGEIIERGDEWTKIRSGELEGWISNKYLYFDEEAKQRAEEVGRKIATVETSALRCRKEPNEESGLYGLLELDSEYDVIDDEELDGWVKIKYGKKKGYVSADYVSVELFLDEGETMEEIKEREALIAAEKAKLSENQGAVLAGVDDVTLLGALIQCEAGNQVYEGQLAVGAVVCNRVRSTAYPNTISEVIFQKSQFGPAGSGKVAARVQKGVSDSCLLAAQQAIAGETTVGSAMHFRRVGYREGIVIGDHVFW